MKKIALVYHSQSRRNEQLAAAILTGAQRCAGIETRCYRALDADTPVIMQADLLIFGGPENFGYAVGMLNDCLSRTYYACRSSNYVGKYALFSCTGSSGDGAIAQLRRLLGAYPMREVTDPLVTYGEPSDTAINAGLEFGEALASGLEMGIF